MPQLVPSLAIGMTMTADFATWIPDGPGVQSVLHGRYRWLVCVMTAEKEPHLSVARTATSPSAVQVVDLFCGVGGLTRGLEDSGINVVAGLDSDADCEYAYSVNNDARFVHANLLETSSDEIESMWSAGAVRVLVGCAPCQPYSKYSRGTSKEDPSAPVLRFAKYVDDLRPAVVSASSESTSSVQRLLRNSGFCWLPHLLGDTPRKWVRCPPNAETFGVDGIETSPDCTPRIQCCEGKDCSSSDWTTGTDQRGGGQ